ncbi:heptaprenyl diphosphate synthase [Scopulibacillus daqui]|uniref:Heptaprenyl diphosphate synthase n=1 Tax=Scopulibacillus daqui TaxID=1469162 RepID=A0ABS2PZA5_9BACL|nr:heptaprenyl diphosphate synthase component 1 [Scopulibacillus daqui]MBM7645296.1 heptaprenyl diphosphate synthase [Scopulibacillus daqui]
MTINEVLLDIKKKLIHTIEHPYLGKYLNQPYIDEDKLLAFYLLFKENSSYKEMNDYVIVMMLVQIALDTHDKVTNEKLIDQGSIKERQLTVLGGDYYSALYYFILTNIPDLKMTKQIAGAIQEINEYKMAFFANDHIQWSTLLHQLGRIESALVTKIASHLGFSDWAEVMFDYFLLKRLSFERHAVNSGSDHPFSFFHHLDILNKKPNTPKVTLQKIDYHFQEIKLRLEQTLKDSPLFAAFLKHCSLKSIFENDGRVFYDQRLAEEG